MTHAAWNNAVFAMPDGPFVVDLAGAISNSSRTEDAARWLLTLTVDLLRAQGQSHAVWDAFDFAIFDVEAIDAAWPVMREAGELLGADANMLPVLARFVAERLPAIWARPPWTPHAPLTRAVVLAERAHDLVALFSIGLKPNGSKDPFALRRAANHWLIQTVFPLTVGRLAHRDRVA